MKPVEYMVEARVDIRESVEWYIEQDPTVVDRFLAELDRVVGEINANPEVGVSSDRSTRSAFLHDFPFRVIFRELPDRVVIISVFHHKRRPSVWQRRLKSLEN